MSEKYALSWRKYSQTVSNSFARFKNEEFLHDVTLVTDDNRIFLAHKFVLSTCSEYFRNILKRCKGQNPYICLEGVGAEEMENIIEYIYSGQVEILHGKLDKFLSIAQRLKIEGIFENDVGKIQKEFMEEKNIKSLPKTDNVRARNNKETTQKCDNPEKEIPISPEKDEHFKKVKIELSTTDMDKMNQIINSFVVKTEEGILRKQVFFFDINKIVRGSSEILWGARYMSNELIFQISASWVIGNITARSETDFEESPF